MTVRKLWYGSQGPITYEDTNKYTWDSDTYLEGARLEQAYLEQDATQPYHAVRFGQLLAILAALVFGQEYGGNLDNGFSDSTFGGTTPIDGGYSDSLYAGQILDCGGAV